MKDLLRAAWAGAAVAVLAPVVSADLLSVTIAGTVESTELTRGPISTATAS